MKRTVEKDDKVQIRFSIPRDAVEALNRRCEPAGRSLNGEVNLIIREFLEKHGYRYS